MLTRGRTFVNRRTTGFLPQIRVAFNRRIVATTSPRMVPFWKLFNSWVIIEIALLQAYGSLMQEAQRAQIQTDAAMLALVRFVVDFAIEFHGRVQARVSLRRYSFFLVLGLLVNGALVLGAWFRKDGTLLIGVLGLIVDNLARLVFDVLGAYSSRRASSNRRAAPRVTSGPIATLVFLIRDFWKRVKEVIFHPLFFRVVNYSLMINIAVIDLVGGRISDPAARYGIRVAVAVLTLLRFIYHVTALRRCTKGSNLHLRQKIFYAVCLTYGSLTNLGFVIAAFCDVELPVWFLSLVVIIESLVNFIFEIVGVYFGDDDDNEDEHMV